MNKEKELAAFEILEVTSEGCKIVPTFGFVFGPESKAFEEKEDRNRMLIAETERYLNDLRRVRLFIPLMELVEHLCIGTPQLISAMRKELFVFGWENMPVKIDIKNKKDDGSLILSVKCEQILKGAY